MGDEKNRFFNRQESCVWRLLRDGDFEESEVWDVLKETNSKQTEKSINANSVPRKLPNAARVIPRITTSIETARYGDSSSGSDKSNPIRQQLAPVNIRDWSKMAPTKSDPKLNYDQDHNELDHNDENEEDYGYDYDNEEEFDEEKDFNDDNYRLPPHEIIARRLARSRISSFSVFEGVGRTLKGRDLSKVRNAVLSKTGFLEQ